MNKQAIFHLNESNYSFAINKETLKIRLRTARNDVDILKIECLWNISFLLGKERKISLMEVTHQDDLFDYYETTLVSKDPRFSYIFKIYLKDGTSYFYSEIGLTRDFDFTIFDGRAFKMSYINELDISSTTSILNGKNCYQIFPERFNKADDKIDKSYVTEPWDTTNLNGDYGNYRQNVFIGGDLRGIINKLDYIASNSVGIIYMTPICKSSSNHKYDVEDYFEIDPMFGNDSDLKELVSKAHKLGIKVVLDLVFNHSSHKHPFFKDVKLKGKNSKYYNWYYIDGPEVIDELENYAKFANVKRMPKLNTNNYEVQEYLLKVGKYFINKFDVDGYRLDVANEVSHNFWLKFKHELRILKKDFILIGEIWTNSYKYLHANEFDSVMNYAFLNACKDFYARRTINVEEFKNRLESNLMRYDENTNYNLLNLIDSHDTPRFYDLVKPNKDLYLLVSLTLIAFIGVPMIYYGDEIFMEGGADPANRKGMEWNSKEWLSAKYKLLKSIYNLRDLEVFKSGTMKLEVIDDLFVMHRFNNKEHYSIYINNSNNLITKKISKNIVISNNYINNNFLPMSFVVIKD